jgi:hypothetical protein
LHHCGYSRSFRFAKQFSFSYFFFLVPFVFALIHTKNEKMENIKNTPVMIASMNINYALFKYLNAVEIAKNIESEEGIRLEYFRRRSNCITIELLDYYDHIYCCSEQSF